MQQTGRAMLASGTPPVIAGGLRETKNIDIARPTTDLAGIGTITTYGRLPHLAPRLSQAG
jgi:hypothetical protein